MILYDIDNKERVNWSPNTFKPRAVLAFKAIAYTTEWISYPDIESAMRSHGQEDAQTVTLPVLKDGERYVADSWAIAKYLEQKVPNPTIFPGGLEAHEKFQEYVLNNLHKPCLMWVLPQIPVILDDRGAEYFTRTREDVSGKRLLKYRVEETPNGYLS